MTPSKQATVSEVKNESGGEIFDDLYLGVRAGGALRKKRRGELLTAEEAEALSRWQRLSAWRKGVAVGGFAAGTFGLGFTLGGLVFGRWRKAQRPDRQRSPGPWPTITLCLESTLVLVKAPALPADDRGLWLGARDPGTGQRHRPNH